MDMLQAKQYICFILRYVHGRWRLSLPIPPSICISMYYSLSRLAGAAI